MPYCDFAYVYDSLMTNAEYDKRCSYILKLFNKFGQKPKLLLDLACGTGAFANRMAKKGIEVIGADMSEEMLSVARENSFDMGVDVLYLCQRAEELDLYGTVDSCICCMDSINHITDENILLEVFKRVSLFLEKDGLFIFDVNTPFKHEYILGDNTFSFEEDGIFCVWKNSFDKKKYITDISLDFFVKQEEKYVRLSENFCERAYKTEKLCELLAKCGFSVENIFDDLSENEPTEKSERIYFVVRKTA